MNIQEAEALASALYKAIDQARAEGRTEVQVLPHLKAMDDVARAELQAAIDAVSNKAG